jgi:hypothetical protein
MAKQKKPKTSFQDPELLNELMYHYQYGSDDMDRRKLRKNGWDDITKAYFGYLPSNWPYRSRVVDPVIRTTILEKTSRMFAGKLRGTVVPREADDYLKSKIINAKLDFDWDNANLGGTMLEKCILSDIQTRNFGASFALNFWNVREINGKIHQGPDIKVIDPRDIFVDYQANHIKSANWVQVREWVTFQDLKNKLGPDGKPIYKNLDVLRDSIVKNITDVPPERRDNKYTSMVKQLRQLEDRVGQDIYFPAIEVVTEYRHDMIYVFCPRHAVILLEAENPLETKEIPISMLRYYPVGDDVYGESEVESVLGLYRAIQALLCGYIDQANLSTNPPIKVANNSAGVRLDTLVYGPNAIWLTGDTPNNVQEHQSMSQSIAAFNNTYPALKGAFQLAMGDNSMINSTLNPLAQGEKTATEIRATTRQQISRDAYNQLYLEEFLKDIMGFWIKMNQQYLFSDPTKETYLIRILGKDILNDLKESELAQTEIPDEVLTQTATLIEETPGGITPEEIEVIKNVSEVPKYPVTNSKGEIVPKLDVSKDGMIAQLFIEKDDLTGSFDYIPDVKSMAVGVSEEAVQGRNQSLYVLLSPGVQQQLMNEGVKINVKDLLINVLEDNGIKNANKLFEQTNGQPTQGLPIGGTPGQQNIGPGLSSIGASGSPFESQANERMANTQQLPFEPSDLSRSQGLPQI